MDGHLDREWHKPLTVIASNFQVYDGYFMVDKYHRQHRIIKQVHNGGKFMQVNFDKICFIDFLSFIQMSNASLCAHSRKPLASKSSRKAISLISSTHQTARITKILSQTSTITCPK